MAEDVFISVCIPAYRRTRELKRLLDSMLIQTHRHFEVVITDDSPGTEVIDLVRQHALMPQIRYFKNEIALGTPENWNESIRQARAEWIKLMHDDDWFADAESLAGFAGAVRKERAGFYFSAHENVYPDGKTSRVRASAGFLHRLNRNPDILIAVNRIGPPSAVLFKRVPQLHFDNRLQWLVDFDFYMRYLKAHPPAVLIPESLVRIGISDSQVTQTSFGNPDVEIPERLMVWEKTSPRSGQNLLIYDSWWRFLRNLKIRRIEELTATGTSWQIPLFVVSMIRWQTRLSPSLLKWGPFSKAAMFTHYLSHRAMAGSPPGE